MRALLCLCLACGFLAGGEPPPEPGRNEAFLGRLMGDGSRPWRTYRQPAESASATVEVVGELTPAELREVAFQEFLAWFRLDLKRYLHSIGGPAPTPADLAAATMPVERFGGNPVPRNVPLARVGF
ncbi:hypothetical protein [Geothrix sp. 21YS21S-4]|uniref:hypothetical protein n=1 Tax=Geothrix sp. 21YS21S-4 TaxID=3068889 RepID=UPI0027BAD200|nr:hypothetical protein [Geothrix sp. 21YS21S-4]